jgi:iron complex transport system substrate-binding protein
MFALSNEFKRRSLYAAAAAIAALALVTGCAGTANTTANPSVTATATSGAFPVTVHPTNGAVTISAEPKHIVSLSPTATEDLFAIGAGSQVIAVDESSDYPADAPKTSLDGVTPNAEAILKYQPDLVIAQEDSNGLVAAMIKVGVPVLVEPSAATLADAYAQIVQLGQATGHTSAANSAAASIQTQIKAAVAKAGSNHANLTYYWELSSPAPYYSATSSTFIGQIMGLFGAKDIADSQSTAADGGYPVLSTEYIVSSAPRLIYLADTVCCGQSQTTVAARPGWSGIPAVQKDQVVSLNDDVASRWGPRLPLLVQQIAASIEKASGQ